MSTVYSVFNIFKVDLKWLFDLQNALWLNKTISPEQWENRPYYEFLYLIESWKEQMDKEKEQREEQEESTKQQQSELRSKYKVPKMGNIKQPKMPKMPKL